MSCLTNYIGLKGCSSDEPKSGKWINSLPGMSTELLDNIASKDQVTYLGVWDNVQDTAYARFKDDIVNFIRKDANFIEVIYQKKRLTNFSRHIHTVDADAKYHGEYHRIPESRYVDFYIREVYVYSDTQVDSVLKVFDVNDGSEIYSLDLELKVGLNIIDVDKVIELKYGVIDIFIGVDASGFGSIKTSPDYHFWYGNDNEPCDCRGDGYIAEYSPAELSLSDDATFSNIKRTGAGKGVVIGADLRCSIDQFICDNKRNLSESWRHLLAFQILNHKLGSFRANVFTTSNLENTAYLRTNFERQYTSMLKNVLKNIPVNDICLNCDDTLDVYTKGSIA